MANLLEDLVAQWFEYRDCFVRRNVKVNKREAGGWEGELDVVALDPASGRITHVEASMDADDWPKRQQRLLRKFEVGERHIPTLFGHASFKPPIERRALFGQIGSRSPPPAGDWTWWPARDLFVEIRGHFETKPWRSNAVPERFGLVRALQFATEYWAPAKRPTS